MSKILITGGTGLVGKHLSLKLENKGHEVIILSRNPKAKNQFKWDIKNNYIDDKALIGTDYIIHLAGAGIAEKRWSAKRKEELINSRVASANLLFNKIKELNIPLKKFISASGIGYYGAITTDKTFTEKDKPYNDFISKICVEWEGAAKQFESLNIPQTILRTGVVLAKKDSALQKINTPLFLASLGSGKQYFPFIHIDDLCNIYIKAIEEKVFTGIYNAVTPEIHTIESFTKTLGKTIKKAVSPINAPSFVLKLALGEMSVILLKGSKISTSKIANEYQFMFPKLEDCFKEIYQKS